MVKRRILFAYLGSFAVPVVLLPGAALFTMGGHSLMFVSLVGCPFGLLAALLFNDRSRHIAWARALARALVATVACGVVFVCLFLLSSLHLSALLFNQGWLLFPLVAPLAAAVLSEVVVPPINAGPGGEAHA